MDKCKYCVTDHKKLSSMGVYYNDTKGRPACMLLAQNLQPIITCPYKGEKLDCELLKELNLV